MEEYSVPHHTSPAMWKNKPFTFIGCVLLCPIGIGFVLLGLWWLQTIDHRLIIEEKFLIYRRGIFNISEIQIFHEDISQLNVRQSFFQRIMRVGTVEIGSSSTDHLEISIDGIPGPKRLKKLINSLR